MQTADQYQTILNFDLTKLNVTGIRAALFNAGTPDDEQEITGAEYLRVIQGQYLVYSITYVCRNSGNVECGNVYVSVNSAGKVVAEW